MKGVIILDKEKNLTSRDEVNRLCKLFNTKKIGHTGTLDPLATGILIICVGKYTKLVDLITSQDKEYIATVKLGILTDTLDIEGKVIKEKKYSLEEGKIRDVLNSFKKTYLQEVPKYSAVKVNGRKLYDYARNNEEVELPKREVTIYDIELLSMFVDGFEFKVTVSKGTYIRSLINDIALELDTYGTMTSLRRTAQGNATIEDAKTFEEIKKGKYETLSASNILNIPTIIITKEQEFYVSNGVKLEMSIGNGHYLMMHNNVEIAIYEFNCGVGKMKVFLKDV